MTSCTELLEALKARGSPGLWDIDHPTLDAEAWFLYDANGQPVAEIIGGHPDAAAIILAVNHLGPLVKALEGLHHHSAGVQRQVESTCPSCRALTALRTALEAALEAQ